MHFLSVVLLISTGNKTLESRGFTALTYVEKK